MLTNQLPQNGLLLGNSFEPNSTESP